jgi:hypothetical protein
MARQQVQEKEITYLGPGGCDRPFRLGNELTKKYGADIVEQPHVSTTKHIFFYKKTEISKQNYSRNDIIFH